MKPGLQKEFPSSNRLEADTTINAADKYAYSANAGWINFEADITNGVVFSENVLSGYAYAANFGWIHFGDGSPTDGISYTNSSASDYGVNHDGAGKLTGYAYSANTGWINFEQTHGQAEVNLTTGEFSGYAYSANLGWINLSTDLATDTMACPDTDNDGIADHYEQTHFGNLTTANATSNDDGDHMTDLAEYRANTDPTDSASFLGLTLTTIDPGLDEASYQITAGPGRILTLVHDESLSAIANGTASGSLIYAPLPTAGTFPDDISYTSSSKRFFQLIATKPLQP